MFPRNPIRGLSRLAPDSPPDRDVTRAEWRNAWHVARMFRRRYACAAALRASDAPPLGAFTVALHCVTHRQEWMSGVQRAKIAADRGMSARVCIQMAINACKFRRIQLNAWRLLGNH